MFPKSGKLGEGVLGEGWNGSLYDGEPHDCGVKGCCELYDESVYVGLMGWDKILSDCIGNPQSQVLWSM